MKKTLVALAVTAFAASSANAFEAYNNNGTSVQVDGSLRLVLSQGNQETKDSNGKVKSKTRSHTNLGNDGSRFGVRVKHDITDTGLFALGRLEIRFDKNAGTSDAFGDLYAKRAYVGIGHKDYGELTFGRQLTIGDDISRAGFDYTYGVVKSYLTTSGNSVVRYDYKGIEGLQLSADYSFATERDSDGEVLDEKKQSGFGLGAVYDFELGQGRSAGFSAGYTHDSYATGTSNSNHVDAWAVSGSYTVNDLTLAATYSGKFDKEGSAKEKGNGFSVGAKYYVIPEKSSIYGNYSLIKENTKNAGTTTAKSTQNLFMLGADYKFHKQALTYIEGQYGRTANKDGAGNTTSKATEKYIGVGMRVYW